MASCPVSRAEDLWHELITTHACVDPETLSVDERLVAAREGRVLEITRCPDGFGGGDLFFGRFDEAAMAKRIAAEGTKSFRWPIVVFRDYAITDDVIGQLRPNPWESFSELVGFEVLVHGLEAVREAVAEAMRPVPKPKPKAKKARPAGRKPKKPARPPTPPRPRSELQQLREQLARYDQMMSATKAMGAPDVTDVSDRYYEVARKRAETLRRIRELEGK